MVMPRFSFDERFKMTPLELEAEHFAYAAWRKFEEAAQDGYKNRFLGGDFTAFLDAVYDQYIESRKK